MDNLDSQKFKDFKAKLADLLSSYEGTQREGYIELKLKLVTEDLAQLKKRVAVLESLALNLQANLGDKKLKEKSENI